MLKFDINVPIGWSETQLCEYRRVEMSLTYPVNSNSKPFRLNPLEDFALATRTIDGILDTKHKQNVL